MTGLPQEEVMPALFPHQGGNFWNQNDLFLSQNDCESKRLFFDMASEIHRQFAKFVSNLPIEIKSQKSKSSLRFAFTFVMRMSWLAMSPLCSVTQSLDNGLDCLGQ
jgi:hypothetical protein